MKALTRRMREATRRIVFLFFSCLFVLSVWQPVLALETIRLAVPVIAVQYAPIYFGIKKGFFAEEGLGLETQVMRTDLAIAALNTGNLDYIAHGGAALRGATRGFPIKLIFALDDKAVLAVDPARDSTGGDAQRDAHRHQFSGRHPSPGTETFS